jgi:hypothetical protein
VLSHTLATTFQVSGCGSDGYFIRERLNFILAPFSLYFGLPSFGWLASSFSLLPLFDCCTPSVLSSHAGLVLFFLGSTFLDLFLPHFTFASATCPHYPVDTSCSIPCDSWHPSPFFIVFSDCSALLLINTMCCMTPSLVVEEKEIHGMSKKIQNSNNDYRRRGATSGKLSGD